MATTSTQSINGPTLLLVDDDEEDRMLMRIALESVELPIPIKELESGEALLDYLYRELNEVAVSSSPPWIVILDKYMPGMDGFATLRKMKEHPVLQLIPVVLFVNTQNKDEMKLCVDLGAMACLNKPLHFDDTKELVRMAYRHWVERTSV